MTEVRGGPVLATRAARVDGEGTGRVCRRVAHSVVVDACRCIPYFKNRANCTAAWQAAESGAP